MASGMEAKHDFAAWGSFQTQALRADGHAAIGSDFDEGAHAPYIIPPRTTGRWPQDGTIFFPGLVPSPLWGLAQFPMGFMGVVVCPQVFDMPVGDFQFGNLFTGEVGRQAALPELVCAFDFAFGLWRGGIAQADVVELECPAQLREGGRIVREKDTMVIDIDLERATVGQKSVG